MKIMQNQMEKKQYENQIKSIWKTNQILWKSNKKSYEKEIKSDEKSDKIIRETHKSWWKSNKNRKKYK